jgi:hypothetical protein
MSASRRFTSTPSPAQIRRQAAIAFRKRVRSGIADCVPMLRHPEPGEVPLSDQEIAWGVSHGLINTARVRAFAEGAGA